MRTALIGLMLGVSPMVAAAGEPLYDSYVEARSCSVFAGACHYNREFGTEGRKATLAFSFEQGKHDGVPLDGVKAVAVVTADRNLDLKEARRKSVLYVDAAATDAQCRAVADALASKCAKLLGTVVATKVVPISFERSEAGFVVEAGEAVTLEVEAVPGRPCCNMPWKVLYKPLVELSDRLVGNTVETRVTEEALSAKWVRTEEASSFYGRFKLGETTPRLAAK